MKPYFNVDIGSKGTFVPKLDSMRSFIGIESTAGDEIQGTGSADGDLLVYLKVTPGKILYLINQFVFAKDNNPLGYNIYLIEFDKTGVPTVTDFTSGSLVFSLVSYDYNISICPYMISGIVPIAIIDGRKYASNLIEYTAYLGWVIPQNYNGSPGNNANTRYFGYTIQYLEE
jgi:hypothetical protein